MQNLLKSDFYKLFKMKSFYVCAIIAAAMAAISMFLDSQLNNMMQSMTDTVSSAMMSTQIITLKNILPTIISPTGDYFILVIIGVCLFITIEYNAGTLKNIAARGFKREYIFLSKIIVCVVEAFIITLCFAVSCVIFGLIFLGTPAGGFGDGYFTELFTIYGFLLCDGEKHGIQRRVDQQRGHAGDGAFLCIADAVDFPAAAVRAAVTA